MADVVLLGVADAVMKGGDDSLCGWSTNKFGGRPNWINGPPEETLKCILCGNHLSHVSQVYCPLQDSQYHRVLYIFACVNRRCWNQSASWKVLRSQAIDSSCSLQQRNISEDFMQCSDEWCDDSEDWGDDDSTVAEIETFVGKMTVKEYNNGNDSMSDKKFTKELSCNDKIFQDSKSDELADASSTFIPYYVSVFEQSSHRVQASEISSHERELLVEYERREGTKVTDMARKLTGTAGTFHSETYEKTSLKHGDQAFYKFHKELQYCPQQCLRYLFNGKPLTISCKDASELKRNVPNCPHCGGERVYELQLMPALVHLLKGANTTIHEPVNITQGNISFSKVNEHYSASKKSDQKRESENTGHCEHELQKDLVKQPLSGQSIFSFDSSSGGFTDSLLQETSHLENGNQNVNNAREVDIIQDLNMEECDFSVDVTSDITEECSGVSMKKVLDILTSDDKFAIEFGTVIVYTCATSCWTESSSNSFYREEFVIVEPDPDLSLFK